MADNQPVTPNFSVSGQWTEDDIRDAASRGVKTVINNRPDGEAPGQPASEALAAVAAEVGVHYVHAPINPGVPTPEAVAAVRDALAAADGPVHAFCAKGGRAISLWALARAAAGDAPDTIITDAGKGGFDLSGMKPALASLHEGA